MLKYEQTEIAQKDLGQMFLIYNKIIISRSSQSIYFFKINEIIDEEKKVHRIWTLYHTIDISGFVTYTYNKERIKIQVITDDRINFYLIDPDTMLPKLENSMFNYMRCTQMIVGR